MTYQARITGTGSAFPKQRITNDEIARKLAEADIETSDDWIQTRTGIRERRYSDLSNPDEHNSSIGVAAAKKALEILKHAPCSLQEKVFVPMIYRFYLCAHVDSDG